MFEPNGLASDHCPFVHFHGGGFVVGSPTTHRTVGAWLAKAFQTSVFLPSYRLAPECDLREQVIDARHAVAFAQRLTANQVTVSGDSAGAMLAALVTNESSKRMSWRIAKVLLFYGVYGVSPRSYADNPEHEAIGLGPKSLIKMYSRVDPHRLVDREPDFSPLHGNFPLHPRTMVVGAQDDPLLCESESLCDAHPMKTTLRIAPCQDHGFLSAPAPSPATMKFLQDLAEYMTPQFSISPSIGSPAGK